MPLLSNNSKDCPLEGNDLKTSRRDFASTRRFAGLSSAVPDISSHGILTMADVVRVLPDDGIFGLISIAALIRESV